MWMAGPQPEGGKLGNCPHPRNFHKPMYLLGAARSYIILPPRKYQLVAALVEGQAICYVLNCFLSLYLLET